ncbi:hypothetical protein [Bacillus solimangrovi]|uniref:Uncharacterized protein n=1 Tax=Bacillus solimangrovi TaxID=1305675 RepID=A0A1E5LF14_9BACI|nr:hypothetical protein [Bacillus solimangrovi]OEH92671.1 hypothetical protein BFG57_01305 [Bacillus solimangrovi]
MFEQVLDKLTISLEDWSNMQNTSDHEGEEWAERFERHFYEFIDTLKVWFEQLDTRPYSIESAEQLPEIKQIIDCLPGPLQLNFLTELEYIIEGHEQVRYD